MQTNDPAEMKRAGDRIIGFNETEWKKLAIQTMTKANILKYTQNPDLEDHLVNHTNIGIVECSPNDDWFGIGMGLNHPDAANKDKWKGKNNMGIILMQIKHALKESKMTGNPFVPPT